MMESMIGKRFGRLTVVCEAEKPDSSKDMHKWWNCKCDCGKSTVVSSANLGRGTKSCGCLRHEGFCKTHGFASHKHYDKIYHTWNGIKYRCYNPNSKDFKHYGKRGIAMCEEWLNDFMSFRSWALSNGFEPNLTIDRINVDGNYSPNNCRWVSVAEQNRNKTTTRRKNNEAV